MGTEDEEYIPEGEFRSGGASQEDDSATGVPEDEYQAPAQDEIADTDADDPFASSENPGFAREDEDYVPDPAADENMPEDTGWMSKKWFGPVFICVGLVVAYVYVAYIKEGGTVTTANMDNSRITQPMSSLQFEKPKPDDNAPVEAAVKAEVPVENVVKKTSSLPAPSLLPEASTSRVKSIAELADEQAAKGDQVAMPPEPALPSVTPAPETSQLDAKATTQTTVAETNQAAAVMPKKEAVVVDTVKPTQADQQEVAPMVDQTAREAVVQLQQRDANFLNRFDDIQVQMTNVRSSVTEMKSSLKDISRDMKKMMHSSASAPQVGTAAKAKMVKRPPITMVVKAAVPGRAWVQPVFGGHTDTVSVGDNIYGYGRVMSIDDEQNVVITSSGFVIKSGHNGN